MLSSVGAKRREFWLAAACALAPLPLCLSEPALAQACGPLDASGSVTCTPTGNNYTSGINYPTNNTPISVTLQPTVQVAPGASTNLNAMPAGSVIRTAIPAGSLILDAVNLANTTGPIATPGADITLSVNSAIIDNTAISANNKSGLRLQASGNATISAMDTQVSVTGTQSTNAIWAIVLPSSNPTTAATVNYIGPVSGPGVTAVGTSFSTVIQAENDGLGPAIISAAGNITGVALGSAANGITGLFATGGSSGSVTYTRGAIDVRGNFANGIYANGDSASVNTSPGTTITVTSLTGERLKPGIALDAFGTAAANQALTATVASTIQMFGPAAPDPGLRNNGYGIRAVSWLDAPITVNYTGPGITTQGGNGMGIVALSGGGSISVTSSGPITTSGSGAVGIFANNANNLPASSPSEFRTSPVFTGTPTGMVQVTATSVATTGQFSSGIVANGARDVMVNIASGGSVSGGWQPGLAGGSDLFNLPAAGVILMSTAGVATLTNDGSIGALSDRAVAGNPQVINNGTITGFVQFTGGDHSFINNGTFNLRHFADTNGDGVRDTVRVAIADLGAGPNNSFTNNGNTLTLPQVTGATTLDSSGQYLPLGNLNNAMALGGPLQGHLIGVTTFTNSGTIDLQSNPAAGDVLVITGARQAGVAGGGTFISNGGTLKLDTVLNQGGAATRSDTLVVDATSVGPGGPTVMAIRNAGGAGALTVGDGILVTQVLNPALSASGAFRLPAGTISAGAYEYVLFKGGVSSGSQGNWYLRSTLVAPPNGGGGGGDAVPTPEPAPGSPPLPTPVAGAAPIILYRPEVALHAVLPSVARSAVRTTLGTFHDREGEQVFASGDGAFKAGWARVFGGSYQQGWSGDVSPTFYGNIVGVQVGLPFFDWDHSNDEKDRAGVFVGYTSATGNVTGFARGQQGFPVGNVGLNVYSVGLYWTHFWPAGGYLDAVLMQSWITSSTNSIRNISTSNSGRIGTASLELGYPIPLWQEWAVEPQAQFIFQRWGNDLFNDTFAQISTVEDNAFIARFGLRLTSNLVRDKMVIKPFALVNLWHGFNGQDTIAFNQTSIITNFGVTALEFGGGVSASLSKWADVYAKATYTTDIDGNFQNSFTGKLGFRLIW